MIGIIASRNWLPVSKPIARYFGSNDIAVFLSELANKFQYYEERGMLDEEGYFYASAEDLEEETCMSRHKQAKAVEALEREGIIETKLKGVPATKHFRFTEESEIQISKILKTRFQKVENQFSKNLKTSSEKTSKQGFKKFEDYIDISNSDNKEIERERPPFKILNTEKEPDNIQRLPESEKKIRRAADNAAEHFKTYPALVEQCREAAKEPGLSKKIIWENLQDWIRHHGNEDYFLRNITKHITGGQGNFLAWMRNYQRFGKPQTKPTDANPHAAVYTPPKINTKWRRQAKEQYGDPGQLDKMVAAAVKTAAV